jgi:hypothetical protein
MRETAETVTLRQFDTDIAAAFHLPSLPFFFFAARR